MKTRLIISAVVLVLLSGCSAFDKNASSLSGFSPSVAATQGGKGQFEGTYKGITSLTENNCEELTGEAGEEAPLSLNIIQTSDLVSVGFEDDSEASGSLEGNKTTVVKRDVSSSGIYHLEFTDTGISGDYEYIEGAPAGGQLGEPCATYSVSLTKE